MCMMCEWEDFVADAESLLCDLDDLPSRASGFADSVREKTEGMVAWAQSEEHVTERMREALDNMAAGVARWMR